MQVKNKFIFLNFLLVKILCANFLFHFRSVYSCSYELNKIFVAGRQLTRRQLDRRQMWTNLLWRLWKCWTFTLFWDLRKSLVWQKDHGNLGQLFLTTSTLSRLMASLERYALRWEKIQQYRLIIFRTGILLPKLLWPTMRKKCFSDQDKLLKFEAEGR